MRCAPSPPRFDVVTLSAKTADVGEANRWTLEEMRAALTRHPGQHLLPGEFTRTEFLKWIADVSTYEFIDWASHTASYDSEDFRAYLRFCAYLPDAPASRAERDTWESLARFEVLQNAVCLQQLTDLWGGPSPLIGFPAESGSGSFFRVYHAAPGHLRQQPAEGAGVGVRQAGPEPGKPAAAGGALVLAGAVRCDDCTAGGGRVRRGRPGAVFAACLPAADLYRLQRGHLPNRFGRGCGLFNGTHTAEEAAERIQNRVTLYLSELA